MCSVLIAWRSFAGDLYLWSTKRQERHRNRRHRAEEKAGDCDRQCKHRPVTCEWKFASVMVREYQRRWIWCLCCLWEDNLDGTGSEHTKKMMKMVCDTMEKGKPKSRKDRGLVCSKGQAEKMAFVTALWQQAGLLWKLVSDQANCEEPTSLSR